MVESPANKSGVIIAGLSHWRRDMKDRSICQKVEQNMTQTENRNRLHELREKPGSTQH